MLKAYQYFVTYLYNSPPHVINREDHYECSIKFKSREEAQKALYEVLEDMKRGNSKVLKQGIKEIEVEESQTFRGVIRSSGQYDSYTVWLSNRKDEPKTVESLFIDNFNEREIEITVRILPE